MMAEIVVPAWFLSMARTCEFLVPARALATAAEAALTGAGRFDDLRIAIFTGRAVVAVLRLDLVLVMGASRGLRDVIRRTTSAPPRQITRQGSAVNFQEVVHSAPVVNADVAKHTVIRGGTEWTLTRMRL